MALPNRRFQRHTSWRVKGGDSSEQQTHVAAREYRPRFRAIPQQQDRRRGHVREGRTPAAEPPEGRYLQAGRPHQARQAVGRLAGNCGPGPPGPTLPCARPGGGWAIAFLPRLAGRGAGAGRLNPPCSPPLHPPTPGPCRAALSVSPPALLVKSPIARQPLHPLLPRLLPRAPHP